MRTTLRIDDDLMRALKERAHREAVPVARLVNRLLRQAVEQPPERPKADKLYRERAYSMGKPKWDLTKALDLAAALEDEETAKKLARGQ